MNRASERPRRWVVKIGSSLLTNTGTGLNTANITAWAEQIAAMHDQGHEMVLVSSGAVAEGMARLGWNQRPHEISRLQSAAAVGQMGLIQAWESRFMNHGLKTAQVLLTHEDVSDRQRYLNARGVINTLLRLGVVPVVNENDCVSTEEIRLGDNDTLAALVVNLIEAELLVILTDQDGLYDADPRKNPDAQLIPQGKAGDTALMAMAGCGMGELGRGGMRTKLIAAQWSARSGADTIIANGAAKNILTQLASGARQGTYLASGQSRLTAKKRWIAGQLQIKGKLWLDDGACRILRESGKSLLAVGVTQVEGSFKRGDLVVCQDSHGNEVARGLVNFNHDETDRIKGRVSSDHAELLGYQGEEELIHRDNLVLS